MLRSYRDANCAVARTLELIGDGWTIMILREAFLGTRRFADFESRLEISKNILTKRLANLVEEEIFTKVDAGHFGARFEYELTRKGKDLITVVTALRQWGDRWLFGEGKEPLLVLDQKTGEPILPIRIRREDGSPVPGKDLLVMPGPGLLAEQKARLDKS